MKTGQHPKSSYKTRYSDIPLIGRTESRRRYKRGEAGRAATQRYKQSDAGRAAKARERKGRQHRDYLERPFRALDGEGITLPNGRHIYTMLAGKKSDGSRFRIRNDSGLASAAIFELLVEKCSDDAINVIYGASYDFNMFLTDLPKAYCERLYKNGSVIWEKWRISWRKGKTFRVERTEDQASCLIYDVVSFFQAPFVKACDEYLGDRFIHRDFIVASKAARGSFTTDSNADVDLYNDAELDNLLELMREFRERIVKVGLRPKRWDGPGALAALLMQRYKIRDAIAKSPDRVRRAARYAYAGGRFEVIRWGTFNDVRQYDVNSAYPAAMRSLPDLATGRWDSDTLDETADFALYHVEYQGFDSSVPGAMFRRDPNGTICYPLRVTGWVWSPEMEVIREYCKRGYGTYRLIERHVYRHDGSKPFEWVEELYNKRRALKLAGDGAHVGLKLGLNSLYGKLAQQIGARIDPRTGVWRIPPYHCIEWAGYVTSYCRAAVLSAVLDTLSDVIAFETDAVFTTAELPVKVSSNLGEWEETDYDKLTYVQSGLYFADGNKAKTRGIDRGFLTEHDVLNSASDTVSVPLTRFVTMGQALHQRWELWQRWIRGERDIKLFPTGKRIPSPGGSLDKPSETFCPMLNNAHSSEYPIVWENPNPDMVMLEELRNVEVDYE